MTFNSEPDNICHSLQQGELCYVLGQTPVRPPSSLCLQTRDEMKKRGYRSIVISTDTLTAETLKSQDWDKTLIENIWRGMQPQGMAQLYKWLDMNQALAPEQRLMQFASELLLTELCEQPTIIFIDSVDVLVTFPAVMETLWAWVEHCCDLRDTYLTYYHLSFAFFATANRFRSGSSPLPAEPYGSALKIKIFAKQEASRPKKSYSWESYDSIAMLAAG